MSISKEAKDTLKQYLLSSFILLDDEKETKCNIPEQAVLDTINLDFESVSELYDQLFENISEELGFCVLLCNLDDVHVSEITGLPLS